MTETNRAFEVMLKMQGTTLKYWALRIELSVGDTTMTSALRLTRQIRPIQTRFVRYNSSKPPPPPTIQHIPLTGEKSIPTADQTTAHVPAPSLPLLDRLPIAADVVSGAPEDLHRRPVRIYRPAKSAMQSGLHGNLHWRIDWDVKPEDNRWEHPVMYWAARYVGS